MIKKIKENGMTPGYFKAAMSGNEREEDGTLIPGDALWVKNVSGNLPVSRGNVPVCL